MNCRCRFAFEFVFLRGLWTQGLRSSQRGCYVVTMQTGHSKRRGSRDPPVFLNYAARGSIHRPKDSEVGKLRYFPMNCWAVGSLGTLRLKFTRRLRLRNPAGDYRARLFRQIRKSNLGLPFVFADARNLPECFDLIPRPRELNPYSWEIILGQNHSRGKSK